MYYIKFEQAVEALTAKLTARGCAAEDAKRIAEVAAGNSLEGVYSHGINRFKRLLTMIDNHLIDLSARAERADGFGGFERWDGHGAAGILSALMCSDRAIELAREHGIGCVALRNTNHWFRAGTYGWRIAEAGMYGAVFTNTKSNTVYYGTGETLLGTTPLVLALPRRDGPIVADVSLVEYSYGKLETAAREGKMLPTPGGYDLEGNLSCDPKKVMPANRVLPLGKFKGSALSMALDLAGAAMSLGNTACDIRRLPGDEHDVSQVFIAINSRAVNSMEDEEEIINRTLEQILAAQPLEGFGKPRYPGQNVPRVKAENLEHGIPVDEKVWESIWIRDRIRNIGNAPVRQVDFRLRRNASGRGTGTFRRRPAPGGRIVIGRAVVIVILVMHVEIIVERLAVERHGELEPDALDLLATGPGFRQDLDPLKEHVHEIALIFFGPYFKTVYDRPECAEHGFRRYGTFFGVLDSAFQFLNPTVQGGDVPIDLH